MKRLLIIMLACFYLNTAYGSVTWKGIEWEAPYIFPESSITVNEYDELEVTPYPGDPWGSAYYSTSSEFRSAVEPFVEVSFDDIGLSSGALLWVEDQTQSPAGSRGGQTQFGAWAAHANYRIYWWDYDSNLSGFVDTGVERTVGNHTLRITMLETGGLEYTLDGEVVYTIMDLTPNFLGDIYLNAHMDQATFTDYISGDAYTVIPLPSAFIISAFGTCLILGLRRYTSL